MEEGMMEEGMMEEGMMGEDMMGEGMIGESMIGEGIVQVPYAFSLPIHHQELFEDRRSKNLSTSTEEVRCSSPCQCLID